MVLRPAVFRVLRLLTFCALLVCLLAFGLVQLQQRLLRHRAERLMSDVHKIRLHQSTWGDAQALMKRWGAWGHYDGTCTARDCRYTITFGDVTQKLMHSHPMLASLCSRLRLFRVYGWLGGKWFAIRVQFLVQDATIWRTGTSLVLQVPPFRDSFDSQGYELIIHTRSRGNLRRASLADDDWVLGSDEQLAKHPHYKAGRPGGCTVCQENVITYTPYAQQSEIERLTSFDFSCLTRFSPCTMIEDVLPVAREWHLYERRLYEDESIPGQFKGMMREQDIHPSAAPEPSSVPQACGIPIWARGRDAALASVVDALSSEKHQEEGYEFEQATVRVIGSLKGTSPWSPGTVVAVQPFAGEFQNPPFQMAEHLTPGKRYILLLGDDVNKKHPEVSIDRCGTVEYAPEIIRELGTGIAQNDALRGPELRFNSFPFE